MHMRSITILVVGLVALVGCGDGHVATLVSDDRGAAVGVNVGELRVSWEFKGEERITRARLFLIDGEDGSTCRQTPFAIDAADLRVVEQALRLPEVGTVSFSAVRESEDYLIWGVGFDAAGLPVALGCVDSVGLQGGKETSVHLVLRNRPLQVAGDYAAQMELSFTLPPGFLAAFAAWDISCVVLDLEEESCDLAGRLTAILSDLDVDARWRLSQSAGFVTGELAWTSVEGVPVDPSLVLVEGGFSGRIPGTTVVDVYNSDLYVHVDRVISFVLQEVMEVEVGQMGTQILTTLGSVTSELEFVEGAAIVVDEDYDWQADEFDGRLDLVVDYPGFDFSHELELDWSSVRER